ncbi:hypothetical protein H5410_033811 [Solanum commersonii]|uniref:Uncharacterized protein n=1 Tax=Solanum commersonii TaxID=4109 RepID=A0A9J5YPP4_SOLCO|nr:hypothetical protein H5410_033811 [Solanum commersonii]
MIVGNLSIIQLSKMQVQVYINEESNRRKNLLEKYICLCNDAKMIECKEALLDLIPIVNITSIVIGTSPSRPTRGQNIAEYVKKKAPEFCDIKVVGQMQYPKQSFNQRQHENAKCICFQPNSIKILETRMKYPLAIRPFLMKPQLISRIRNVLPSSRKIDMVTIDLASDGRVGGTGRTSETRTVSCNGAVSSSVTRVLYWTL